MRIVTTHYESDNKIFWIEYNKYHDSTPMIQAHFKIGDEFHSINLKQMHIEDFMEEMDKLSKAIKAVYYEG